MRTLIWKTSLIVALAAVMLAAASLAGCAAGPVDRWHHLRADLTAAQDTARGLWEAGVISDRQLVNLDQYADAARTTLKLTYPKLPPEGQPAGERVSYWLDTVERVLDQMIAAAALKRAGSKPGEGDQGSRDQGTAKLPSLNPPVP